MLSTPKESHRMRLVEAWIAIAAISSIITVTIQTLWDYRQRHDPYRNYDLQAAIRRHPVTGSIDELRIPGLTEDEADEFWHAVND